MSDVIAILISRPVKKHHKRWRVHRVDVEGFDLESRLHELEVFECARCGRFVPYDFGCADDLPDMCDRCWHSVAIGRGPKRIASRRDHRIYRIFR